MTDQNTPAPGESAPDPARSYERAKPQDEPGMGRLDNNEFTPAGPDRMDQAVASKEKPTQINAQDRSDQRQANPPGEQASPTSNLPPPQPVDHSMDEEEPDGWDLAPSDIHDPRHKRHPRTEGKGGTP